MFEIDWRTPHLWAQTSKEPVRARPALTGEHHADVAIVGGGYTGLSTALSLAEAGLRTIVIEANAIGSGSPRGATTASSSRITPRGLPPRSASAWVPCTGLATTISCATLRAMPSHLSASGKSGATPWTAAGSSRPTRPRRFRACAPSSSSGGPRVAAVEWLDADAVGERVGSRYLGGGRRATGATSIPSPSLTGSPRGRGGGGEDRRGIEGHDPAARRSDLAARNGGRQRRGRAGVPRHQRPD